MSTTETTVERKASRWEDYVDVFFSPSELYARRAHDSVAPAFWTLLLLSVVLYYAFLPANQEVIRAGMESARAQMAAQGQDAAGFEGMVRFTTYLGGVIGAVMLAISVFAAALLLWLVARMVEVKATYRQGLVVAVYAGFIYVLMQLAASVLALVVGDIANPMSDLSFGLLRFIEPATPPGVLEALLRRTELFLVWQAVVWAIGVRVVMGASRAQAAIVAAATWLLFALPGVISAALGLGQPAA